MVVGNAPALKPRKVAPASANRTGNLMGPPCLYLETGPID